MNNKIKSIAVIGSGTMGSGIAALAADKGCKVLLLDISTEAVEKGKERIVNEINPMLSNPEKIKNIETGTFENDFHKIADYDWICEAVVEKVAIKKDIFSKIEKYRSDSSFVSSNTSGITLKDITDGMPERLLKDICITHFFNPVKIMKLCELIPGEQTSINVIREISNFLSTVMEKGVVHGKDTVNFIGNRIGCYFMLKGLHEGKAARSSGFSIEQIDALLSKPMGLPPTGLYGLIDLIGLDVMHSVGKNLELNLPKDDIGLAFVKLPQDETAMFSNNQLGRKTGGGFYRVKKLETGEKLKETFNLQNKQWQPFKKMTIEKDLNVMLEDSTDGKLAWNIMGATLLYAADLIPEIADNIFNIDRAMRWGFAWQKGPFEMLDQIGPNLVIEKCLKEGIKVPKMLQVLNEATHIKFYNNNQYLDITGVYKKIES
jgi:3-hydroxyacyl-CoA dehydrogenase